MDLPPQQSPWFLLQGFSMFSKLLHAAESSTITVVKSLPTDTSESIVDYSTV
jgi:hypothetical protein